MSMTFYYDRTPDIERLQDFDDPREGDDEELDGGHVQVKVGHHARVVHLRGGALRGIPSLVSTGIAELVELDGGATAQDAGHLSRPHAEIKDDLESSRMNKGENNAIRLYSPSYNVRYARRAVVEHIAVKGAVPFGNLSVWRPRFGGFT